MTQYSFLQVIMFFFAYCFLGWIWETGYVSIREHKFVNRGFLHGPLIPIYGFGAMAILFATLPVKDNLWLVFICGMFGASALELVTGCTMEAIFHVRYWDYTNIPTNIKGYISLPTSIVWGLFSILMIKFIHRPIEHAVLSLSQTATEVLTVFLVMFGSMDLGISIRDALDLKEILSIFPRWKECSVHRSAWMSLRLYLTMMLRTLRKRLQTGCPEWRKASSDV